MTEKVEGVGCAAVALGLNTLLMGLLALGFVQGPYSSHEQEIWYRYGSISFLIGGAILPAAALALGGRRYQSFTVAIVFWAIATLLGFFYYAMMSGGGV